MHRLFRDRLGLEKQRDPGSDHHHAERDHLLSGLASIVCLKAWFDPQKRTHLDYLRYHCVHLELFRCVHRSLSLLEEHSN